MPHVQNLGHKKYLYFSLISIQEKTLFIFVAHRPLAPKSPFRLAKFTWPDVIIRSPSTAGLSTFLLTGKQGDNVLGSTHLSVCSFVFPCSPGLTMWKRQRGKEWPLPIHGICLCVCNQGSYADDLTEAVNQLLTSWWTFDLRRNSRIWIIFIHFRYSQINGNSHCKTKPIQSETII